MLCTDKFIRGYWKFDFIFNEFLRYIFQHGSLHALMTIVSFVGIYFERRGREANQSEASEEIWHISVTQTFHNPTILRSYRNGNDRAMIGTGLKLLRPIIDHFSIEDRV